MREIALELVRGDGVRVPILVNARLARDDGDAPAFVHVTVFDATERRRYERELLRARAEAEERAASAARALEHVAEGVAAARPRRPSPSPRNPAAAEILGLVRPGRVRHAAGRSSSPAGPRSAERIPAGTDGDPVVPVSCSSA